MTDDATANFYALFDKKPVDTPPPASSSNGVPPVDDRYAAVALQREVEAVRNATEGTRNHTLNTAAFSLAQLVASGALDEATVRSALTEAATAAGLGAKEIEATLASGIRAGAQHPRPVPESNGTIPAATVIDLDPGENKDFWDARPLLRHIHDYARSRRVSPWAVLGVTLARIATATPWTLVLPPTVGGQGTINLFVGLVGRPGAGKGAASAVAAEALTLPQPITIHRVGSGEGLIHSYRRRIKMVEEWVDEAHAVLFTIPEIDTLSALGARQGATLLPELRSAWSGETLGFGYADPTKRLLIPEHQYRLCVVAGIQPGRAQTLLDDTTGGTPQRFLWLPATDPDAPDKRPITPEPMTWQPPAFGRVGDFDTPTGRRVMPVCDTARHTIDQAVLDNNRGAVDALDGHSLYTRLKAAAALALADSRVDVNDEDWSLAGVIMRKSDATRAHVTAVLAAATAASNRARGEAEGDRAVRVKEKVDDAAVQRVCQSVLRILRKHDGWAVRRDIITRLSSTAARQFFDDAIDRLDGTGQIEIERGAGTFGADRYQAKGYSE